jgi:hypothetical protein
MPTWRSNCSLRSLGLASATLRPAVWLCVSPHMEIVVFERFSYITKLLFPTAWFGLLILFIAPSQQHGTSNP